MPVPTQELKLEIVNAATGQPLGAKAVPSPDGALVVRDYPENGPGPEHWLFTPVQGTQDDPAYVISNASSGKVLDNPATSDRGIRQWDAAANKKSQQWRLVSVDGEAGLYFIEDAADGNVLDLAEPGTDNTRIVLGEYDDSAQSQRWRLVPAEPERTSDLALRWAPLSHWNSRQSWHLAHTRTSLRPTADATPSFSNVLQVLAKFGSDQDAGGWTPVRPSLGPTGQGSWWAGLGERFLADTTGTGKADIVGLKPAKGAVTSPSRGDGTFDDERVLHPPASSASPADLWTLARLSGEGCLPSAVVLAAEGVRVSAQDKAGTFAAGNPVLKAFGHGKQAGNWLADKHLRLLADTTGDGRLDIVGCHDDGVWVSLQDDEGAFSEPLFVLDDFGVGQGWDSVAEHPRFLVSTISGEPQDIVGFGPQGVVVSRGRGDGTFEPAKLVRNDFGQAQGWSSNRHLRVLADVTGDGAPDIVAFGDEGVWVSHNDGAGGFEKAQMVCRGFGYNEEAGGWRVDRHPRFLADITGDGRVDIVGFGGPGVHVARNLYRRFTTR
ncbi:RICIN domain-containing protein [Streptomyces sp. NPDC058193]|uniref:RICIN domain-containing protein n=1 Tax=Streptomyces sp. NPDC058193 TaxID=3346373 RepID=UPI0036F0A23A